MKKGDVVVINGSVPAFVVLATSQYASLLLSFDGIVDGHVGFIPVMRATRAVNTYRLSTGDRSPSSYRRRAMRAPRDFRCKRARPARDALNPVGTS